MFVGSNPTVHPSVLQRYWTRVRDVNKRILFQKGIDWDEPVDSSDYANELMRVMEEEKAKLLDHGR